MVKKEFYEKRYDDVNLYRTYSDLNFKIRKIGTNELYDEAIDVEDAPYEYEETNIPIQEDELDEEEMNIEQLKQ